MQIRLKPYHKNIYSKAAVLIKGDTAENWAAQMQQMDVEPDHVRTFPVPSREPNILYGCILFFGNKKMPADIGSGTYLQLAEDKLLLPEYSCYTPGVDKEELENLVPGYMVLLHPETGVVILDEHVNWADLFSVSTTEEVAVKKPVKGTFIPSKINAFAAEISDEKLLDELLNPKSENVILENLPFDMKKLMKGNKREMEKYLKYLEQHPEKALDFAIPLDMLGTFRGKNNARFSFSGSWWQDLWGSRGNTGSGGSSLNNGWYMALGIFLLVRVFIGTDRCNNNNSNAVNFYKGKIPPATIVNRQTVLDSHFNSLMVSKRIALQFRKQTGAALTKSDLTEMRKNLVKLDSSAKGIRDSLKGIYEKIVIKKADSIVAAWRHPALDSIKKKQAKKAKTADLKNLLKAAEKIKARQAGYELGVYYGTIPDSTGSAISFIPGNDTELLSETAMPLSPFKKSLLLVAVLIVVALFFVWIKAPDTEEGKLGFGGDEVPGITKLFAFFILVALLMYVVYPLIAIYGFGLFSILVSIVLILLLYRLFSRAKSILEN